MAGSNNKLSHGLLPQGPPTGKMEYRIGGDTPVQCDLCQHETLYKHIEVAALTLPRKDGALEVGICPSCYARFLSIVGMYRG